MIRILVKFFSTGTWYTVLHSFMTLKKVPVGKGGYEGGHSARFWDNIQREFACCGMNGVSDWTFKLAEIPESCCQVPDHVYVVVS
jgi:Tetraspanin family